MLKLAVAALAVALVGTAAAGWRDLRVDGSSEDAFTQSMDAFKKELSPAREYVFGEALRDIWNEGAKAAEAEQREFNADEFYRQLDGLRYEEVVNYTDPTGDTAKTRYRNAPKRENRSRVLNAGQSEQPTTCPRCPLQTRHTAGPDTNGAVRRLTTGTSDAHAAKGTNSE